MKKYCLLLIFIITILLLPLNVKAFGCNYTELSRLKKIAGNVSLDYEYVESNNDVVFKLTFTNLQPGIILKDVFKNIEYTYSNFGLVLNGYEDGKKYRFDLYTTETECENKNLATLYADLPKFNQYYDDPICNDKWQYSVCSKWYYHNLSYNDYVLKVNSFIKDQTVVPEEPIVDNYAYIWTFLSETYQYFLITFIVAGLAAIYYLVKKDDFNLDT